MTSGVNGHERELYSKLFKGVGVLLYKRYAHDIHQQTFVSDVILDSRKKHQMSLKALAIPLLIWCGITACGGGHQTSAPIIMTPQPRVSTFRHIVLIIQENRTPDNLFYALCADHPCHAVSDSSSYDIQTSNWLDKHAKGGVTRPAPAPLANDYKLKHLHPDFLAMCDLDENAHVCRMDGAGDVDCAPRNRCTGKAQFRFVDNSDGILDPYLALATQYGWANQMYQTNQGPSFPAHQYLFGATSAPNRKDDHKGTFAAENVVDGCLANPDLRA